MSSDFNVRLATARTNLRRKVKLSSMLRSAQKTLVAAKREQLQLQKSLAKEQSDVDALQGLSMTALFFTVLGSKEQRLEKERQELLAAKLKYDQATSTVADLGDEVERLKLEIAPLEDASSQYERVFVEKEKYLAASESAAAKKLTTLAQQIADMEADRKELQEAVVAGISASRSVEMIQQTLGSAAGWGTLDMLGGGMLTTMVKHSKMDAAKSQARIAQRKLIQFQEELADADERLQVALQINGFSKFADYFFDGLIADWIVQSKIQKAKSECNKTISQVQSAIRQCQSRLNRVESQMEELAEQRRELIEEA